MKKKLITSEPVYDASWKGYTLNELRYRRAYVKVKLDLQKEAIITRSQEIAQSGNLVPTPSGPMGAVMRKVMGSLSFYDYASITVKMGSGVYRIVRKLMEMKRKRSEARESSRHQQQSLTR